MKEVSLLRSQQPIRRECSKSKLVSKENEFGCDGVLGVFAKQGLELCGKLASDRLGYSC